MSILTWILFLIVAASVAWVAEKLSPNKMPGGMRTVGAVAFIGAWIGGGLIPHFGPLMNGVYLVPTILGAAAFIFIASLIFSLFKRARPT
ncbi:MAG TPA: GlsB/YeaQ/YmgE family stress response membrane protein [Chroococcales cyanobacterium]